MNIYICIYKLHGLWVLVFINQICLWYKRSFYALLSEMGHSDVVSWPVSLYLYLRDVWRLIGIAPSHCLNQCWVVINKLLSIRYQGTYFKRNAFINVVCKTVTKLFRLKHNEAETKWLPFHRRHFQMHFLEWKCLNFYTNFTDDCSKGSN